ncbi:ring finger domain-containing protein [Ditylenchus destructor]|nr:ring finger domain-containing protein [Ditylenchus destructor]
MYEPNSDPRQVSYSTSEKSSDEANPSNSKSQKSHQRRNHPRRSSIGADTCPICLSQFTDATVLDGCIHVFCYACIMEWMKMKAQCPLCKATPKLIKHNLVSNKGDIPTWSMGGTINNIDEVRSEMEMEFIMNSTSYPPDVERHAVTQVITQISREIQNFKTLSHNAYGSEAIYQKSIRCLEEELKEYEDLLNMFPIAPRRQIFNDPAFRRVIYLKNLTPRSIVPPRSSFVFDLEYVKNHLEAARIQLLPYIVREMASLTRKQCLDVDVLLQKIFDYLLNRVNRMSIVSYLNERGIRHPHQLLNNLMHFANTGQSLVVYDQNSEYLPRSSTNYLSSPSINANDDVTILNSGNSDIQVVGESSNSSNYNPYQFPHGSMQIPPMFGIQRNGHSYPVQRNISDYLARRLTQMRNGGASGSGVVELSDSDSEDDRPEAMRLPFGNSPNDFSMPSMYSDYIYTPTNDTWRRHITESQADSSHHRSRNTQRSSSGSDDQNDSVEVVAEVNRKRRRENTDNKPKPSGWSFEKDREKRTCFYRLEYEVKNLPTATIFSTEGKIISATANEPQIASQLYSSYGVNAAYSVGRLLAYRCKMAGISSCKLIENSLPEEERKHMNDTEINLIELKREKLLKALQEDGIAFEEPEIIPHTFLNDPNMTWEPFFAKPSRENKLDELDLSLEPGKGVC